MSSTDHQTRTYLEVRTYLPTSTNQYHPLYPYTNQGSFIHQSLGASQYQYNHQSEYGNEHQNPWINDPNVPRTGLTPGYHPGQDFTDPSGFPVTVYGHQAHYNVGQIPGPSMAPLKRKYGDDDDEDFVTAPRKREMPDWDVKAFETVGSKRGKKAQKLFADQEPINYENAEDDPGYTSPCPALTGFSKDNLPDEDADIISATTPAGARKNIKMDANGNPVCGPRGNPLRDLGSDMPDRVSSLHEDTWQLARIQRATGASSQDFFNRMILEKDTGYQTFCNRLERYLKADGKLSVRNWVPEKWENGKKIEGTPVSKQDVLALKCNDFDQMRYNCAWEINAAKTHMRRTDTSPWRPLRYPQGNFHETNDRMKRTSREVNIWRAAARAKGLAENKFEKLPAFVEAMKRTPSKKVAKKAAPAEANSEETTSEGPASEDDDLEAAVGAEAEESDFADSVPEIPGLEGGNMAAFETSGADSDDDFGSESEAEE